MQIKYLGHASFFIKTKDARVVTDPYDPSIGMKFPKTEGDIVTVSHSHPDHSKANQVQGDPLLIDWPGEYEKNGVRVFGYKSYHDKKKGEERGENILFKIESEGISVLHCGDMGVLPDDKLKDEIGEVDILLVPVGGFYTIDAGEAIELIKQIEPAIVIPMHYNHPKLDQKVFKNLTTLDEFVKKFDGPKAEPADQLTVKKEDLAEEPHLVVLNIS
ncbi:hypothetical protein A3G67_01435 [Candidatus Roizmanbacteria bacterium RIFCSPLOWO2_12_FULL_40_12]|uniref:Lactamase n=1 Tax=Candidatus Roizmanbacteria bacterium RIFCSPLOWO2_01_FULL_40_42 TaxID=1802066 RepID=A0A1F7J486_9BACT|nr:MAG: hypothetical protein A2779_00050 [Candidatus Roizmanbacteria bacterium RIFCSPHIGHO2_01_FULL_40_98]OGK28487.1 MAG: hypothetical protein A3C31_02825 [Candidatus Roizmanbacteria bacterium RIFCSPHIGHO2_02_FULL_40_53]OGK29378.1 MAG: hypothetical protein A2W49_00575 [Candidatus Roizmanbacteria bacterium RIFCSPHIGHO2_12_41_18]OGK36519.1 MAG: hypothetical protein A3E69_03040 [Candidatus Roizmanbacteria bacterium RIFCSPHIGHO2_12_FULL_40_130]OGK50404.1 MAG: hypothetical protein A3B50_04605 [Candi